MNRKVENIVEYFNTRRREECWAKVSDFQKEQLEDFLEDAKRVLIDKRGEYDNNGVCLLDTKDGMSKRSKTYFKGQLGYSIFGVQGIKSGLYTEASISSDSTAEDHLLGAMKIGETAFIAYCKSGFDNEYMKNVWLYENLYLWLTITVSSNEHNNHISKDQTFTIDDKRLLKHYGEGVSSLLFNLKEIVYFRIDIQKAMNGMPKSKLKEFRISFLSSLSGDTVVKDNENKEVLKYFLDKGYAVKYSEYV